MLAGPVPVLTAAAPSSAAPASPAAAGPERCEFAARDLAGTEHHASEKGAGATAWVFIAHDCPICNGYAPELARIVDEYAKRGARVNLVYAESGLSPAELQAHAQEHGYTGAVFADGDLRVARGCGVNTTPEAVVVTPEGVIAYRGRIDNLYYRIGQARDRATIHDLRDALDAVLAHRAVVLPRTPAFGCAIELQ